MELHGQSVLLPVVLTLGSTLQLAAIRLGPHHAQILNRTLVMRILELPSDMMIRCAWIQPVVCILLVPLGVEGIIDHFVCSHVETTEHSVSI